MKAFPVTIAFNDIQLNITLEYANDDCRVCRNSYQSLIKFSRKSWNDIWKWSDIIFSYGCESHRINLWTPKFIKEVCKKHEPNSKLRSSHAKNIRFGIKYAKNYLIYLTKNF